MSSPQGTHGVLEDYRLVRAVLRRDVEARREFADRLTAIPRMLQALNRRTGRTLDAHDIEDLSQDVAAVAIEKLPDYEAVGQLEGWLYGICTYQLLNAVRRARKKSRAAASVDLDSVPEDIDRSADVLAYELVEKKLARLGPPGEEVIRLRDLEGRSFAEIAELLNASQNTIKARYYRGLEALRRLLKVKED